MLYLLVATFLSASFGLIVSWAQRSRANLYAVGATNYVCATLVNVLAHARTGGSWVPASSTWMIGIVGGLCFVSGYLLLFPAMSLRGVSIATAMLRLAVVVPMLAGWLLWGETLGFLPTIGALLALASLPLLTLRPAEGPVGLKSRGMWLLLALLTVNGGCLMAVPAFNHAGSPGQSSLFLAILFGTAALVSTTVWFFHRQGTTPRDLLPGTLLGLCNALANVALITALQHLPGLLVFPFYSAVGIVFTALFARVVWRERIGQLELGGMGMAVVAVVLANL